MNMEFNKRNQEQMSQWLGSRKKFTLLFKATKNGCTAKAFHSECDNKGQTVTILYNTDNSVYGGYTSVSWRSSGGYFTDEKAFLFRLYRNGKLNPVQMKVSNASRAINDQASYGPTFGGHDLQTFTGTVNMAGTYFPLNGSTNFGHSYTIEGEDYNSICNGHLRVKDIEVYLVEDLPQGASLDKPWRTIPEWNTQVKAVLQHKYLLNTLMDKMKKYKPIKDLKVAKTRILMIGQVGAGKSSFFNTVNSIFRGYITSQACTGSAEHSLTTVYRMYQVREGILKSPMNFRLHDTRGLEVDQGIDSSDICYVLDGNIPDGYEFNPSACISPDIPGFISNPHLSDQIHCVAFVIDGSTIDVISEKVIEKIRKLQCPMNQRGIPQVILLTNVDKLCEITNEDLLNGIFYSRTIMETVDRVSQIIGLPRSHILPIKNYESELQLSEQINILTLLSLQHMLQFADDYMYNYLDYKHCTSHSKVGLTGRSSANSTKDHSLLSYVIILPIILILIYLYSDDLLGFL